MKPSAACSQVLLNPVSVELTGPSFLEFIPLPVVKLKKHWPPLLIWLFSHTSNFSRVKQLLCPTSNALSYGFHRLGLYPVPFLLRHLCGYRIITLTCPLLYLTYLLSKSEGTKQSPRRNALSLF